MMVRSLRRTALVLLPIGGRRLPIKEARTCPAKASSTKKLLSLLKYGIVRGKSQVEGSNQSM